ncbi:MAG: ankyrin repeat domain-containing protein [Ideonella sp.]|nr:ankyrin repeat domain-containing protein [Ideonella sp.]
MILSLKNTIYLIVAMYVSSAIAGSYEDFFIAVKRNDGRTITALVERGFDPNTRGPNGEIGLVAALHGENMAAAEALFARPDIRLDLLNGAGESALMMAALRGDLGWCERLIARGAPVNKPGWSPLHYAASGPEPKIIALLLERSAIVDAESPDRTTPLMMAARYGKEDSVKLLLARGADAKRTNDRNMSAADFARGSGREWLAEMLTKAGG